MTTIYYVRHGQTEFNKKVLMYGSIDADINETGIEQAKATAEMLKDIKFDKIYVSGMKRAQETCSYINKYHNLPLNIDPRLNERTYGDYEGVAESTIPNVTQ
jgi:broad specificity phosphatase PhoE